jgi:hypothetical protein
MLVFLQGAAPDRTGGTEEETQLTETLPADDKYDWTVIAIMIDRLLFVLFTFVYLSVFVRCFV